MIIVAARVETIVNSVFSSNTYLISSDDSSDSWLVDCGDMDKVMKILPDGNRIRGLFLTHTHFDHIYGINELARLYPECLIYTSEYGATAIRSSKLNLSRYHECPVEYAGDNLRVLNAGDIVKLYDGVKMSVIETPGHCPSCLSYMTDEWLFSGDSYIQGLKVVTNLPKGDKALAQMSVEKIKSMVGHRMLLAGHGDIESK